MNLTLTDPRLSQDALMFAATAVAGKASLDWLPREHQNTVVNIFYLGHVLMSPTREHLSPFITPGTSFVETQSAILKLQAKNTAAIRYLNDQLAALQTMKESLLRVADADGRRLATAIYDIHLQVFLDMHKWDVPDAANKSAVRRSVERRFKTSSEIDNLIDLVESSTHLAHL